MICGLPAYRPLGVDPNKLLKGEVIKSQVAVAVKVFASLSVAVAVAVAVTVIAPILP